jgi:hypothetical protein
MKFPSSKRSATLSISSSNSYLKEIDGKSVDEISNNIRHLSRRLTTIQKK